MPPTETSSTLLLRMKNISRLISADSLIVSWKRRQWSRNLEKELELNGEGSTWRTS